ncbi:polysaccharide deacetylase family protein [Halostagnicola sp. A-GB9-2]|uniref:polysaccharide deacetylase family protein n=1 Tax=Halostagnicola sp. A-GB9-2 TaxID=3048066 RepID=UPI0024BF8140|nr:polysaccharide deacetylase family protein [Halostagnicola sp. A-GB9-2]MDJ1434184.1 polysaccharide deacetylase family protein [Halostagnicola sp. A-GB9-2]
MFEDYEFTLCLTHDVDRPYKTFQAPYYALKEHDLSHLKSLVSSDRPYWQFEEIMELEEELGVRSSFYFLNEKNLFRDKGPREWIKPNNWKLFTGRYNITDDEIVDVIQTLDRGGWEVGLHGSYESYNNLKRLRYEKETLEDILGHDVIGGRQHYLNLNRPKTWEYHQQIGLKYDASLGSSSKYGFQNGYNTIRPFDDEFTVFPLTLMEVALFGGDLDVDSVKHEIDRLLHRASECEAIVAALWHPRVFNERDFPGYKELYRYLITSALEMGAWVGPIAEAYDCTQIER